MRKFILVCITLLCLTMFGCTDAPDSVKSREKQYSKTKELTTANSVHRTTVEHILDNKEKLLSKKYQNIELPQNISASQPQSVGVLHAKVVSGFKKHLDDFFTLFYKKSVYKGILETLPGEEIGNVESITAFNYYKKNADFGEIEENGFCNISRGGGVYGIQNRIKVYHIFQGDKLSDTYQLEDGKMSIKSAVDKANQWCKTHWSSFEQGYTYQVQQVYVCKTLAGKTYLVCSIGKYYNGIPFNDIMYSDEKDEKMNMQNTIEISLTRTDNIAWFTNNISLNIINTEHDNESYVDLEGAISQVENQMSGFKKFHISDITIKYMLDSDYKTKDATNGEYEKQGAPATARPVWSFIITHKDGDDNTNEHGGIDGAELRSFINVDMITGEVIYQKDYNSVG